MGWQALVENTVTGLGYDFVECERSAGGLLRVFIDRVVGDPNGAFITVDDCERVTRQLQYVIELMMWMRRRACNTLFPEPEPLSDTV